MVVRTIVTLEDDLDGSVAEETVRFSLDTAEYEIDLSAANADKFRAQLAEFTEHARKVARGQQARSVRSAATRRTSAEVRAWAREQGIEISERGRIPASVTERYQGAVRSRP